MKDDQYCGCGLSWLWALPENHIFTMACQKHDDAYIKGSEEQKTKTRKEVDQQLLTEMLAVASSKKLKILAYFFYGVVRVVGGKFWEAKK